MIIPNDCDFFSFLPGDVKAKILGCLKLDDLSRAVRVNKELKALALHNHFWRPCAQKLKLPISPGDSIFQNIFTHLTGSIQKLEGELPPFFKNLLSDPLASPAAAIRAMDILPKWKKARDTLVIWRKIAEHMQLDSPKEAKDLNNLKTTLEEAEKFDLWIKDNTKKLSELNILDLPDLHLSSLPESIGKLTGLRMLMLRNNDLTSLPESFGDLTALISVFLPHNQLKCLPDSFGKLSTLQHLILHANQLHSLPKTIRKLTCLKELSLTQNQLTALPKKIGCLTRMKILDLSHNQISALPASTSNLIALKKLNLEDNPLKIEDIKLLEREGLKVRFKPPQDDS